MKNLFLLLVIAMLSSTALAQNCPKISVTGPTTVTAGDDLSFFADVKDATTDLTYNWTVSDGTITSGQGTSSITVDSKETFGATITASVELGGLPRECNSSVSSTVIIIPAPKLILEGKYTTPNTLNSSIQEFIKQSNLNSPGDRETAFIFLYKGEASTTTQFNQVKTLLRKGLEKNGLLDFQYKIVEGGKKKFTSFEMYTMVTEAAEPKPTK